VRLGSGRRSGNVEDRRGMGGGTVVGGGLGTVVLLLLAWYFGIDPTPLLQQMQVDNVPEQQQGTAPDLKNDPMADFVSAVLGDTEDTWQAIFAENNGHYVDPTLVLFTDTVSSACGYAQAAMGPFYCSQDQKVYIDLGFYKELRDRFNAPGDFAEAYVIAHEVGHHVQNLLGVSQQVQERQQTGSKADANRLSVRLELQADCFAGVWASRADRARQILEAGDVDEALNAATAIGDDRLQRMATGHIAPDRFTHGTSAQRVEWFRRGLSTGDPNACDTFAAQTH